MFRFLRESVKEFDHVVWPTRRETVRYFTIVLGTIAVFTVFLFIVGTAFSTSLFTLRGIVNPTTPTSAPTSSQDAPEINLEGLTATGTTASGVSVPVVVSTGTTASGTAQ